jgi:hypothetical protein
VLSALVVLPLYFFVRAVAGPGVAAVASLLVLFNPLFWMNSVRPLSDVTGFAAIVTSQYLLTTALLAARSGADSYRTRWFVGTVAAALAVGVRLQAVLLVGPLLALGWVVLKGVRLGTPALFLAGVASWLLPTFRESGGAAQFWAKQVEIVTDMAPSESLVADFGIARAWQGLADTWVAPWGAGWLAALVLMAAAAGLALLARRQPRRAGLLLLIFGPYALYHWLFQETLTIRYAIPLLPLVGILAAVTVTTLAGTRRSLVAGAAGSFAAAAAWLTVPALTAYVEPSPPARAVAHLRQAAEMSGGIVVGADRVFTRYVSALPKEAEQLRTTSSEEWRALDEYWRAGRREPVWFLQDPARPTLERIDGAARTRVAAWRWPSALSRLMKGARPIRINLQRLEPPRWFAAPGFATEGSRQHASSGPDARLLFARSDVSEPLIISGLAEEDISIEASVGGTPYGEWRVSGAFSLPVSLPSDARDPYLPVRLESDGPVTLVDVTIAANEVDLVRSVNGIYKEEPDEFGTPFRWLGQAAELFVLRTGAAVTLTLSGRVPVQYYDALEKELHVSVDGKVAQVTTIDTERFEVLVPLAAAPPGTLTRVGMSVSDSFVPDRFFGNHDFRPLSLMLYDLDLDRSAEPVIAALERPVRLTQRVRAGSPAPAATPARAKRR